MVAGPAETARQPVAAVACFGITVLSSRTKQVRLAGLGAAAAVGADFIGTGTPNAGLIKGAISVFITAFDAASGVAALTQRAGFVDAAPWHAKS